MVDDETGGVSSGVEMVVEEGGEGEGLVLDLDLGFGGAIAVSL